ncbi:MAG TPA: SDR family oxidoreductase [Cyclobacteriaceae bacterium]|nr:SDR family oxidoreductase [Cyclobacteriaceae bacterium]
MSKNILITGAGSGLGKETSCRLAAMGYKVIMVCRNLESGEPARQDVISKSGNPDVDLLIADLSSFDGIRNLAGEIYRKYEKLDVLLNNAGVFVTRLNYTRDGHELQWAVNHLAPFLLTGLLIDLLGRSTPSRIITVSSVANYKGLIHFDDPNLEKKYNGLTAYRQSKLANVLFTFELAERIKSRGIKANCLHPGIVRTRFGHRNNHSWMGWLWYSWKPFMFSVKQGAYCMVKLASDPALEGISGKYFDFDGKEKIPNRQALDPLLRNKLWTISESSTGFSY